jgi:hypothetical protein
MLEKGIQTEGVTKPAKNRKIVVRKMFQDRIFPLVTWRSQAMHGSGG